jgi:hypothetical protein
MLEWISRDSLDSNRGYVADLNVITTSGVSASIPISVALIEAIAGRGARQGGGDDARREHLMEEALRFHDT